MNSATAKDAPARIPVAEGESALSVGWPAIMARLQEAITERGTPQPVLVVECHPAVNSDAVLRELESALNPTLVVATASVFHPPQRIESLIRPWLEAPSTRGQRRNLLLTQFFDAERLWHVRREIEDRREGLVLIVGCGASLVAWGQVLVFADLTRDAARARLNHPEATNLGLANASDTPAEKCRIASLVDWPVMDRWKRPLLAQRDFLLGTVPADPPELAAGDAVQRALQAASTRPFCFAPRPAAEATPLANPGSNGHGPVMARSPTASAWQEETVALSFGARQLELPALDLLLTQPRAVLGPAAYLRYGVESPLPLRCFEEPVIVYALAERGPDWREERAVLHEDGVPVELRRLRFARGVAQNTNGQLLVLRLVGGPGVCVESPTEAFAPVVFHHGQTFIVPAGLGEFVLRPAGLSPERSWVILKASLRRNR